MVIHYELMVIYGLGITPREAIRNFGYSRGTAYRFHRIYREARKRAIEVIIYGDSVSPRGRGRVNNLGERRKKKRVSQHEKWKWIDNGETVVAVKEHEKSKNS